MTIIQLSQRSFFILLWALILSSLQISLAQTTAFNYQGRLLDAGNPANGNYEMQFKLFDALMAGAQIGLPVTATVLVANGAFTAPLDFGAAAFDGAARYLEIAVRPSGNPNPFTLLSPRQQILSTPYGIRSLSAAISDNATQLGGVDAARFVQSDAGGNVSIAGGLTVAGGVTYDTVNAQTQYNLGGQRILSASSEGDFVVPQNLFVGLSAGRDNTTGHYNTFVGFSAGKSNTFGTNNSFFGSSAGFANRTGGANSFFGSFAGAATTSYFNSFFGSSAGENNTSGEANNFFGNGAGFFNTTGSSNAFFGASTGQRNISGSNNSFFGIQAGLNNTASDNSFFGHFAGQATTTGELNSFFGINTGLNNTTGSFNSFYGQRAGMANTDGCCNAFFGGAAGAANTTGIANVFIGGLAGASNTTGAYNVFVGGQSGYSNTTASENSFFGDGAGYKNTTGINNSFFGRNAGRNNTASRNSFFGFESGTANLSGTINAFFGYHTGFMNTTGSYNTFIGDEAGMSNTTGEINTFVGNSAGHFNSTGYRNAFFGNQAGWQNTIGFFNTIIGNLAGAATTEGVGNTFLGSGAGSTNTTGNNNSFIGRLTGPTNTVGSNNVLIGFQADFGANNLINANAIGANALVSANNSMVLGSINGVNGATADTNVGIGTTAPQTRLQIRTPSNNYGFTQTNGTTTVGSYISSEAGWLGTVSNHPLFFFINGGLARMTVATTGNVGIGTTTPGSQLTVAGLIETTTGGLKFPDGTIQTTAGSGGGGGILNQTPLQLGANFNIDGVGKADIFEVARQYNILGERILGTPGQNNIFLGIGAGAVTPSLANNNIENTFFGTNSGQNNLDCCNAFFGNYSGQSNTTGGGNTFLGYQAGKSNTQGSNNTFVGLNAGYNLSTGSGNTFVGDHAGNRATGASSNTFIGVGANLVFGANNLTYATAIGANAEVDTSNTIVIGKAALGPLPADTVRIPGNLVVTGTFSNPSDIRLKKGIADLRYGLSEVMRLRPVTWEWKNDSLNITRLGLIAQEVQPVLPELVEPGADKDRMLSMNYLGLLPIVIKAIQEQEATIATLRNEITGLQKQNGADVKTVSSSTAGLPGQGIILKSPNGATCKLLSLDNSGAMVLTAVACP